MEKILDRPRYTLPLKKQVDVPLIKVLTGVRRCGKTTIMNLLADYIRQTHPQAQILSLSTSSPSWAKASKAVSSSWNMS